MRAWLTSAVAPGATQMEAMKQRRELQAIVEAEHKHMESGAHGGHVHGASRTPAGALVAPSVSGRPFGIAAKSGGVESSGPPFSPTLVVAAGEGWVGGAWHGGDVWAMGVGFGRGQGGSEHAMGCVIRPGCT